MIRLINNMLPHFPLPRFNPIVVCLFLFLFFAIYPSYNFAESPKTDSLKSILQSEISDTSRIKILHLLTAHYLSFATDSGFLFAKQALQLSKKANHIQLQAESHDQLAQYYWMTGNYSKALEGLLAKLNICEKQKDKLGFATTLGNIAIIYNDQGDYPNALKFYYEALKCNKDLGYKRGIALNLSNLGTVYQECGNPTKALNNYFEAMKIDSALANKNAIARHLTNIGNVYNDLKDYKKSITYFYESLKLAREYGDPHNVSICLGNLGTAFKLQWFNCSDTLQKCDSLLGQAKYYYFEALKLATELGKKYYMSNWLGNLGMLYTETGQFEKANTYLDSALSISTEIGALNFVKDHHYKLTSFYDTLAKLNTRSKLKSYQTKSYCWRLAFQHHKKYTAAQDSLFNEEKSKDIGRLEQKNDFEMAEFQRKKDALVMQQKELMELDRRNTLQYSGILIGIVLLFGTVMFAVQTKLPKRIAEGMVFFMFLILFEFLLVLTDPYVAKWTGGAPIWELCINAGLAGLIFPFHQFIEKILKGRLLKVKQKNSRINWPNNSQSLNLMFAVLGLSFLFSFTQHNHKIDFLRAELIKENVDSTHVKILNDLAWEYFSFDPDSALMFTKQALQLSKKTMLEKQEARSYGGFARYYWMKGDYPRALNNLFIKLKLFKKLKDDQGIAFTLNNIGIIYGNLNEPTRAIRFYSESIKINKVIGNKKSIADALGNIGLAYDDLGDLSKANKYYTQSLEMNKSIQNKVGIATNLGNIGSVYASLRNYPKAIDYAFDALAIDQELGNKDGLARHYGNLGNYYTKTGKFKMAKNFLDTALRMSIEIGILQYQKSQNWDLSYLYDTLAQVTSQTSDLSSSTTENYWQLAYLHHKKYSAAKDSLFNQDKSKDIGRLEQKHEYEMEELKRSQEEAELQREKQEALTRRNSLQYSAIFIGIVLLFLGGLFIGRANIPVRFAEGMVFFMFLILFEFILVLTDPYVDNWTGGAPVWELLVNAGLAGLIFPLHGYFEFLLKKKLIKRKYN